MEDYKKNLPRIIPNDTDRQKYASMESGPAVKFDWYRWQFAMDPALDYAGVPHDGIGEFSFRLFVPEAVPGAVYPLVAVMGGMDMGSCMHPSMNFYADRSADYASEANQKINPCYIMNFDIPFEACASYEAELIYMKQMACAIRAIAERYNNTDMDRIYITGFSMGAGFAYEAVSQDPDLAAALLINAGTTVHTTWGDQCDMKALADSPVNMLIWHGYQDVAIPVNEAYRVQKTLTDLGKRNIRVIIQKEGHGNSRMTSPEGPTEYTKWLFAQRKGVPFTETPLLEEEGSYADYLWAGWQVFVSEPKWAAEEPYASWAEPRETAAWKRIRRKSIPFTAGEGGCGRTALARVRIPCELVTTYDDAGTDMMKEGEVISLAPGDSLAITPQGYTGELGDDAEAFRREWEVDWSLLEGSVTGIRLTCEKSEKPISRPASVTTTYGGGINRRGSIATEDVLNGKTPYIRIDTAKNAADQDVRIALRFTRTLEGGTFASYYHMIRFQIKKHPVERKENQITG